MRARAVHIVYLVYRCGHYAIVGVSSLRRSGEKRELDHDCPRCVTGLALWGDLTIRWSWSEDERFVRTNGRWRRVKSKRVSEETRK